MMLLHRLVGPAIGTTIFLLAGCDSGIPFGGSGNGAPVDAQVVHPNGTVLQVLSVRSSSDRALVTVRVINGRDREIRLGAGRERSYIVIDSGEKLMLVASPTNPNLAVPPGKVMDGSLVFVGVLPKSGRATLILNENDSGDSRYSSSPRFEVLLPLEGSGGASVPETSALSGMRPLPASRLGRAASGGSAVSQAGQPTSSLQMVDKLTSELGAVETDRGMVVSLPGDVTFDYDKATIQQSAQATLNRLAQLIGAGGPGEIVIEGHTDARGDDAYNKRLSEQRAAEVKSYLVEQGIEPARMRTIGLGELRPTAPNATVDGSDDEVGRQRNRRVEVILPKSTSGQTTPDQRSARAPDASRPPSANGT